MERKIPKFHIKRQIPQILKLMNKSYTSVNSLFESLAQTAVTSVAMSPISTYDNIIEGKNIIIVVGLPACGKSTISNMLTEYLNAYTTYKCKIFNCGRVRRKTSEFHNHEFFDPNNEIFKLKREMIAMVTLNNLINELNDGTINVGILDATNTTIERRNNVVNLIHQRLGEDLDNLIILDIQCNNAKLVEYNIVSKTTNDDYKNQDFDKSIQDFSMRLENYRRAYQPITQQELEMYKELSSYIVVENGGGCKFNNYTKNEFVRIMNEYFEGYSKYESVLYRKKVLGK